MIKKIFIRYFLVVYKIAEKGISPTPDAVAILMFFYSVFTIILSLNLLLHFDKYLSLSWFFAFTIVISIFVVVYFYYRYKKEIFEKITYFNLKFYEVILCLLQIIVSSWILAKTII
jgi:hypothetical protein